MYAGHSRGGHGAWMMVLVYSYLAVVVVDKCGCFIYLFIQSLLVNSFSFLSFQAMHHADVGLGVAALSG